MKCPSCGSEMEEKKNYPGKPGVSVIERQETCPMCGKTLNLKDVAYFKK